MAKEIYHALSDPDYQDAYVDVDEMRTRENPNGGTISFRYMHGGFPGKSVKFSLCFPEKDQYTGRFFHYLSPFPGPDEEMASFSRSGQNDHIAFALINGAYFIESNMGSAHQFGESPDPQRVWKASAAVAEYSRKIAMRIYDTDQRPTGVVYGGSGGGYKAMACIENTDAWEAAVPYVIGSPASLPNTITMHVQGERVLRHAFGKILDNIDAGGCGQMDAGLNEEESSMLRELTKMGFPPLAWYPEAAGHLDPGSLPVLVPSIRNADSSYFEEFWTLPGFEGSDPASGAAKDRFVLRAHVVSWGIFDEQEENGSLPTGGNGVDDAWKKQLSASGGAWLEIDAVPDKEDPYLEGTKITFPGSRAADRTLLLDSLAPEPDTGHSLLTFGAAFGADSNVETVKLLTPGDEVLLDNSDFVSVQSYYRHQVPDDLSFHAWDQFRNPDGTPKTPQRPFMGYGFTGTGTVQDGEIQGKVLQLQALTDESTCPWCADWYREKVREKGKLDDMRTYFFERCMHGDNTAMGNSMVVNYLGGLYQALLDVSDWVMKGKEPLQTTNYECVENQIIVDPDPAKRNGMQAGITLTADGEKCLHVKVGEQFTLRAEVILPENAGLVVAIDYDFHNDWGIPATTPVFDVPGTFTATDKGAVSELTWRYDRPGTYFAAARVSTHREGRTDDLFRRVLNLDRVRIIVE